MILTDNLQNGQGEVGQSVAFGRKKRPFPLYFCAMTKLKVGQKAPNSHLQTLEGESVTLDRFWGNGRFDKLNTNRSALLIFLRHLA
jgi:hypothetical protein